MYMMLFHNNNEIYVNLLISVTVLLQLCEGWIDNDVYPVKATKKALSRGLNEALAATK